ncbi:MAG: DNA polymerase III, subunits gamma and tau [Microgenomates bacterium 39_7]|nr:MAG: DNA polymerase III, subunits gamma and tau [Microgenomates bacterium 39_7]
MSWYLKYRPHQVADLDLTRVREQLLRMMESGKFPQTFLFAGPKGTGKTSASRIIGAMLNDPANEEAVTKIFLDSTSKGKAVSLSEPDPKSDFARRVFSGDSLIVQEMDAASHRGIDDIRQLKERIFIPPQEGSMSVYILDEVHMLTNEAFNALLKILEEPPPHVVFILATTELHKVPATIVSRCNLITFYKANTQEIIDRLKKILKQEKIDFEEEALLEIARRSDGSFRDAVKLAEISSQSGKITLKKVDELIGGSALVEVKKIIELILAKDEVGICQFFISLRERNYDEEYFIKSFLSYLHQNLLGSLKVVDFKPTLEPKVSQFLLNQLIKLDLEQTSPISFLPLELLLLSLVQRAKKDKPESAPSNDSGEKKIVEKKSLKQTSSSENKQTKKSVEKLEKEEEPLSESPLDSSVMEVVNDSSHSLSESLCERWHDFLQMVEGKNSTLAALLRSGQPHSGPNGVAQVEVYYRFHQEQLEQPKLRKIIEDCGQKIVGDKISFKFILTSPPTTAEVVDVPAETKNLETLAEEVLM